MSQPGDNTLWVLSPKSIGEMRSVEAKVITAKPKAATNMPHAMRAGALTSWPFLAKMPKNSMLKGVSDTTKNGLNCWKSEGCVFVGSSIPKNKSTATSQ